MSIPSMGVTHPVLRQFPMFVQDWVEIAQHYSTERTSWYLTEEGWCTPSILSDRVLIPQIHDREDIEQTLLAALIELAKKTLNTEILTPFDLQKARFLLPHPWVITSEQYPFPLTGSMGTILSKHIPPNSALVFRGTQEDNGLLSYVLGVEASGVGTSFSVGMLLVDLPFYIEGPKTQWGHLLDTGAAE